MHRTNMLGIRALAVPVFLLASVASAQEQQTPTAAGEPSTACMSTHLLGSMNICFSTHGNIMRFESPAGFEHIRIGAFREGYALCSQNLLTPPGVPAPTTIAYDSGDMENGFNPALDQVIQPLPNAFPLTVIRTSVNGLQLTQSYSADSTERDVTVTMTVRNMNALPRFAVRLDRYFDGDIDNTPANDLYSRTADSVWGYQSLGHGLLLTDISPAPGTAHTTAVQTMLGMVPASCGQASVATPTAAGDFAGRLSYSIGTLPPGASRTVRINYRRM